MMFDDSDPRLGEPDAGIPPGYRINPQTGELEPIPQYQESTTPGQTPWVPGSQAPSSAPPGMHWDPTLANFVPDAPKATETPTAPSAPPPGPSGPAPGSMTFAPPAPSALPTFGGSTTTIPGAPQFPTIPKFAGPSMQEAMADPGYQFVLDQGRNQLQNWAAARGTLNDSSTAKALEDYGQGAAAQQYGNVWDRAYNTYNTNTQTQYLDPWQAQYQTWQTGTVNPTTQNFLTNTASTQHSNDINWQEAFDKWREQFHQGFSLATA